MSPKERLRTLMKGASLTYEATAIMLHVSKDTIHTWLKPAKQDPPEWAIELLALKTHQPYVPRN